MNNFTQICLGLYVVYSLGTYSIKYFIRQPGSHFNYGDNSLICLTIFIQLLDIGFYFGILKILTLTSKKLKFNRIILEGILIYFMIMMMVFTAIDTINSSALMQNVSFAYFKTYQISPQIYKAQKHLKSIRIFGIEKKQTTMEVVIDFFDVNGMTLILMICNVLLFVILCLINFGYGLRKHLKQKSLKQLPKRETNKKFRYLKYSAIVIFSMADIILFVIFLSIDGSSESKLQEAAPGNWQIWKSLSSYKVKESKLQSLIQQERSAIPLPEDVYYLDNRENNIQFPYVVGSKEIYCKFNNDNKICQNINQVLPQNITPPNVVLIIVESMSTNPLLLKDQPFTDSYNYTPFNEEVLPNLAKLSSLGSTNIGVTSLGIPTILGWFGIQTGNIPLRYGIGIIQQRRQTHLTLAKIFKNLNYSTSYVSPAPPHFDGKQNLLYNGDFDSVTYEIPTAAKGYANFTDSDWIADRITEEQMERSIKQQTQPFFANWFTIDTHANWEGYDDKQYYNESISNNYVRMANYFDAQLGKFHEFLKKDYNNTIVLILGDHGPRWAIYPSNYTGWDFDCSSKAVNDEFFGTTATTAYLGDNPALQKLFNSGVSYNRISDVNQFFLEFQNNLTRILQLPLISNRVSAPYSLTHRVLETHLNQKVTRSYLNSFLRRQEFDNPITCRKFGNETVSGNENPSTENLKLAKKFIVLRNSISAQNRMWDDQFYCKSEKCDLPQFKSVFNTEWDFVLYVYVIPGILLPLISFGVIQCRKKIVQKRKVQGENLVEQQMLYTEMQYED